MSSLSVDQSFGSAVGAQACQALTTVAADENGQLNENIVTSGAGCVAKVSAVTTPRCPPPPPRQAQRRSGSMVVFAIFTVPSAVTISTSVRESQVRP